MTNNKKNVDVKKNITKILINCLVHTIIDAIIIWICVTELNSSIVELLTKISNESISIQSFVFTISIIIFIIYATLEIAKSFLYFEHN